MDNKKETCLSCGNETKRTNFRSGSMDQPKRDEQHCSACGQHQPAAPQLADPPVQETTDE